MQMLVSMQVFSSMCLYQLGVFLWPCRAVPGMQIV